MSSSSGIIAILLNSLNYIFVLLLIFNLLKVNYLNPIVAISIKIYKPISKILFLLPNQIINIFIIAVIFKFLSLMVVPFWSQYEMIVLIGAAAIQTLLVMLRIFLFAVIGGVILSWISPEKSNAFLELVEEISHKILSPVRKYIPSAGGLDFSPLFIFILINLLENLLTDILRSIL